MFPKIQKEPDQVTYFFLVCCDFKVPNLVEPFRVNFDTISCKEEAKENDGIACKGTLLWIDTKVISAKLLENVPQ
jgi:hypothetical protein